MTEAYRRPRRARLLALPLLAVALGACAAPTVTDVAPAPRPLPQPVPVADAFLSAVQRGTRTLHGEPGPSHWTNYAEYDIRVELRPGDASLAGTGVVVYHNRSPDTLTVVDVHLRQNLHAEGVPRNRQVEVTGGLRLRRVAAQGRELSWAGVAGPLGTVVRLQLPQPLPPGGAAELAFAWDFRVPSDAPRMGTDGEVFALAYWYPQIAVYDDVHGWVADPYLGAGEFYMPYADYRVAITVPDGWLIGATGTLDNPREVLSAQTRRRLAEALTTDSAVQVVTAAGRGAGAATVDAAGDRLTWRFTASNVRDFMFAASAEYVWDATRAVLGSDTVAIHALYRPRKTGWRDAAGFTARAVTFFSELFWPYPWPQMTSVEGVIGGGMEYPMITLIARPDGYRGKALWGVIAHEVAHMWFPMIVGSNEKRYTWQDESLAEMGELLAYEMMGDTVERGERRRDYLSLAGTEREVEMMRHGDNYPDETSRIYAAYRKGPLVFLALRAMLGDAVFDAALREYGRRWSYRHPTPLDLWNAIEHATGQELDWFWRSWFYETWTLDQAISAVRATGGQVEVVVEDRGLVPMPVLLEITRADGSVERVELPVEPWLQGRRRQVVRLPARPAVVRVEIDPELAFPDTDRSNQVWRMPR